MRILPFLFSICGIGIQAQVFELTGRITSNGEPVTFASVVVEPGQITTSSNEEGFYSVKLAQGDFRLLIQHIGYAKTSRQLPIKSNVRLDIELTPEGYTLGEVEVKAGEDPAYPIIRKAMAKRKYFLGQLGAYSCRTYIKGLQRIDKLPRNIAKLITIGGGTASDTSEIKGIVYLSESETRYHFKKPNNHKEIMLSSKVSGDNRSFSFNQLSDLKLDFYRNVLELGDLSDRPFVSPIAQNAFGYYRYFLLGSAGEGQGKSYKIKVVARQKTSPCFNGLIYIQDSAWRITGVDFELTKDAGIDFVDTVHITQLHNPVKGDSIWMPSALNLRFRFAAFGFSGSGYFHAAISQYTINPEFPRGFFKNEVLHILNDANKKDSAYWEEHRSVPLTPEEVKDYHEKDSIARIRSGTKYKDSVDHVRNRFRPRHLLFGYNYQNSRKEVGISFPGMLASGIQYNTIEGLNLSYRFSLRKSLERRRYYNISGQSRYGFSNKLWGGELQYSRYVNPLRFSRYSFKVKSIVEQFNHSEPISPLVNSLYTLLYNENHMKLFKESGAEGSYSTEITNGLFLSSVVRYMQRDPLNNASYFLIIDNPNKYFSGNDPRNSTNTEYSFAGSRALTIDLTLKIHFKQKYSSLPDEKVISGSKYPQLNLNYRKAVPAMFATTDYDFVSAEISDHINFKLWGQFRYVIRGGSFLRNTSMDFMDYKHFLGNRTIVNTMDYLNSFRLLPYYAYSTKASFLEGHAEYDLMGRVTSRVPYLKKLNLHELFSFAYLETEKAKYAEFSFGIDRLFKIMRIDYAVSLGPDGRIDSGIIAGLRVSF